MSDQNTISFDFTNDVVLWQYPADSFATSDSILVKANQTVVLMQNGNAYDVLDMGVYTPDAETLPLIFAKNKLGAGYSGMIDAEIWFVNRQPLPTQPWQAAEKDKLKLPAGLHSASVSFTAGGTIGITIKDAGSFLQNTEPSGSSYISAQAFDLIKKDFFTALPKMLAAKMQKDSIDAGGLTAPYDALAGFCMHYFNEHMMPVSGYRLSAFTIDSIKIITPAGPEPEVPPRRPLLASPTLPDSDKIKKNGCLISFSIIAIVGLVFFFISVNRTAKNNSAAKNIASQQLYDKMKAWAYTATRDEDSVMTDRQARMTSDQTLEDVKNGIDPLDLYWLHGMFLDVTQHVSKYTNDSVLHFTVPVGDSLRPFAMKRSRSIMLRFDSDTTITVPLTDYYDGSGDFTMTRANALIPRLRKSHKLSVMLTTLSNPDTIIQYTFHTEGLEW
jgi:hypothetical protein